MKNLAHKIWLKMVHCFLRKANFNFHVYITLGQGQEITLILNYHITLNYMSAPTTFQVKRHLFPKVLVIPRNRWLRLNMTEKLLTGKLNNNQNKTKKLSRSQAAIVSKFSHSLIENPKLPNLTLP